MYKTNRGFNTEDLTDKYGGEFYIRQSSANMRDVWLGIRAVEPASSCTYHGNEIGDPVYAILIDDETWKKIKKARKHCRKR